MPQLITELGLPLPVQNCLLREFGNHGTVEDLIAELESPPGWKRILSIPSFGRVKANQLVEALDRAGWRAKHGWHGPTYRFNQREKPEREKGTSVYLTESEIAALLAAGGPVDEKLVKALTRLT